MANLTVADYQCATCKAVYPIAFDVPVRTLPDVALSGVMFSGGAPHGPDKKCRGDVWHLVKFCDHPCMCHGQFDRGYNPDCPCHVSENE